MADMCTTVDLMDKALSEVVLDKSKFLEDNFHSGYFQAHRRSSAPFVDYLKFMFKKKTVNPVKCNNDNENV